MKFNRKSLWLLALVPLVAACGVQRGYDAKPVVGPNDVRETEVPDIGDTEAREDQDCFVIEIYAYGWFGGNNEKDEGIACMVEPTNDNNGDK